ncbi:MAG: amidohydrolase, partial [Actinobacteria bacterium]|nr:amidohydrolase [Actinomycetota bacterium]
MGMPTDLGIVDLGMGFPYTSVEDKKAAYDFFKANLKDKQSLQEFEFPAQYMFKDVPDVVTPDTDVVAWIVEKMDAFNIEQCMTGVNEHSIRAKAEHPGRFHLCAQADPNKGMEAVRNLKRLKAENNI